MIWAMMAQLTWLISDPKPVSNADMRHLATCLAAVDRRDSLALVRSQIASSDQGRISQRLSSDHPACLQRHGWSLVNSDVERGMISEIYLHKEPSMLERASRMPDKPPIRPSDAVLGRAFLYAYATCLYRAAPARSVAVLGSEADSPEERAAVVAYGDLLKECMPNNMSYHLNFSDLRTRIATVVYYEATDDLS